MTTERSQWEGTRILEALRGVPCPGAWVDLDAFDGNRDELVARAAGMPIRLATKSVRCLTLIRRALANPGFRGLLVYSAREAVMLSDVGHDDIVVAYPVVDPREIAAFERPLKSDKRLVLMADRPEHLAIAGKVADERGFDLPIAFDLDLSSPLPGLHFGVRRSSIVDEASLDRCLEELKRWPRLRLVGAMGYEAQIAGVQDTSPLVRTLKSWSAPRVFERRARLVERIRRAGYSLQFVNGGGTGSLEATSKAPGVTELAAGSGLYSPVLFDRYDAFHHRPAAGFVLDVTRKPAPAIATCFGGGYIASGSPGKSRLPVPVWPKGLKLLGLEGAGEVQTPVEGEGARELEIGSRVLFRHAKAGELCERFDVVHLVSKGKIVQSVPTYRGQGWNFG
jgi:D-serine deaminase-like pyridoxal phosphate-dependent protein